MSKPINITATVRKRDFGWGILSSEMDKLLFLSMLFSCLLTVVRVLHTEHRHFLFLNWNLFLAYIPYFISSGLMRRESRDKSGLTRRESAGKTRGAIWRVGALLWLLFIPNAFYIITDLYHLADLYNDSRMPKWFDLAMILSFVWNGLLLGVLSVRQMERMLLPKQTLAGELIFLYPIMWLNALGIYIGRYLRYNSWDIVTDPFRLLRDIALMVIHPFQHQNAWDMVLCFSILMTLIYLMMRRVHHALI